MPSARDFIRQKLGKGEEQKNQSVPSDSAPDVRQFIRSRLQGPEKKEPASDVRRFVRSKLGKEQDLKATDRFEAFGREGATFKRDVKPEERERRKQSRLPEKVEGLGEVTDKFGVTHKNVRRVTEPTGRQFLLSGEGKPVVTERGTTSEQVRRIRGGTFQETQKEVDHLIPKALGGTDEDPNLKARKNKKTISQKAFDFVTGKDRKATQFKPENRQEGKMVVEHEAIRQFRDGKISMPEARAAVVHFDDPDFVRSILGEDAPVSGKTERKGALEKAQERPGLDIPERIKGVQDFLRRKTFGRVDPDLAARLKESGQEERLAELEREEVEAGFASQFEDEIRIQGKQLAKDIVRAPQRAGTAILLDFTADILSEATNQTIKPEFVPKDKFEKFFLGERPIRGFNLQQETFTDTVPKFLSNLGVEEETAQAFSGKVAPAAVLAGLSLDLVPIGVGGKKAAERAIKKSMRQYVEAKGKTVTKEMKKSIDEVAKRASKMENSAEKERIVQTFLEETTARPNMSMRRLPAEGNTFHGTIARLKDDTNKIDTVLAKSKTVDKDLNERMGKLKKRVQDEEDRFFRTLTSVEGDESIDTIRKRAQEETEKLYRYEGIIEESFGNEELELAYGRFKEFARRRKWVFESGVDDAMLKSRSKRSDIDDMFYPSETDMTNDEMLDLFRDRYIKERDISKPSLRFLGRYAKAEERLAKAEERLLFAEEELKVVGDDKSALGNAISKLEKRMDETQKFRDELKREMARYKDIGNVGRQLKDVWRNTRHVFGDDYKAVKKDILDPLDDAKGELVDETLRVLDEVEEVVVKRLGIKKNSKESSAVQQWGEGIMTTDEVIAQFGRDRAGDIFDAAKFFRNKYDQFIDEVNDVRKRIYPNQPDRLIKRRKDYFRHFQEMDGGSFDQLLNIFDTPSQIDPKLVGISKDTKPRSKFLSFAQQRKGDKTKYDALGGYLNYVRAMEHAKHIDPVTANLRKFRREIADATSETKNLNNYVGFLDDFTNNLAGKTHVLDRIVDEMIPGGRTAMRAVSWLNRRVKANIILGKVSNIIVQAASAPQVIASGGKHIPAAARDTMAQIFRKDITPIDSSRFIKERFGLGRAYDRFDRKLLDKTKLRPFARWITTVSDEGVARMSWNAEYRKAIARNAEDAVREADEAVRELVAGRGIGELPVAQSSRIVQLAAPFQIEVQNLWWVLGRQVDKKQFGQLVSTLVLLHVFNKGTEASPLNRKVVLDPIGAVADAIELYDKEQDNWERVKITGGRLGGEVLSNVIGGNIIASVGSGLIPNSSKEDVEKYLGDTDPRRFGSGLVAFEGVKDPVFKLLPPLGGQQLQNIIEGTGALREGEVRTRSGQKMFDVDVDAGNVVKAILFGKYGVTEAKGFREDMDLATFMDASSTLRSRERKEQARDVFNELKELPSDEANKRAAKLKKENPELFAELADIVEEEKQGITILDKRIKGMGVQDGTRARFMWDRLQEIEGREAKNKKIREWKDKGLLSDTVLEQLKQIKEKGSL